MLRQWLRLIPDQEIGKHLLAEEGEHTIDVVRHHWVVYCRAVVEAVLALLLGVWALFWRVDVAWIPMVLGLGLVVHAVWTALTWHMDVFVVTNMRVFRASGVLSVKTATMPISRILDITVEKPFVGRILGYGHFVFESAAQAQGLRDIRYIGDPDERDLTIQRVVQRSGLRKSVRRDDPHG
ncbi:MAG: PH domain-containing protein [Nocardioidaceae bacterium]|nr:PH domain-containing protein [Nocardioidaceae bacterium]